jgi:outer membrane biosynthesis protein TonB
MTNPWIRAQDRKRSLVAAASTACIYIIAFLAAWLIGMLAPMSLASVPGTVIVDLGGMEGPPGQVPLGLPNAPERPAGEPAGAAPPPEAGSEPPPAPELAKAPQTAGATSAAIPEPARAAAKPKAKPAKAVPPKSDAKAAAQAKTIPEKDAAKAREEAAEAAAAQAAADARAAEVAAAERAAAATAQAAAGPAKTKKFGSGSGSGKTGAPVSSSGSGSAPGVEGGTGTATFRGSEAGNPFVTTFGASTGQVGRNIFVPIYMYMPLPSQIDASVNKNIAAKETFKRYYDISGPAWLLKSQPSIAERDGYWNAIEAAGYDVAKADYKAGRKLSPVILEFAVGPLAKNRVELVDVRLVSSSGSPEIDQAVIYGFRRASFFNKTGYAVGGKFVYEF